MSYIRYAILNIIAVPDKYLATPELVLVKPVQRV